MLSHIEFDNDTNKDYLLGFMRDNNRVIKHGFIGIFENNKISDIIAIDKGKYHFYNSFKSLEIHGFTEKSYKWTYYIDQSLDEIKSMNISLAKIYKQKVKA